MAEYSFLISFLSALVTFIAILCIALPLLRRAERKKSAADKKARPWGNPSKPRPVKPEVDLNPRSRKR